MTRTNSTDDGPLAGADVIVAVAGGADSSLTARAGWILFGKTVGFALSFALPLLLVRRLSQQEFGVYKQAFLVIGTALAILPMGFGMSAYYFMPRDSKQQGPVAFHILLFYLLTAGAACFLLWLAPGSLMAFSKSWELAPHASLIGLAIFFWVLPSFLEIVAISLQEARLASAFIIGTQLTKASMLLAAAILFGSVRALLVAAIVQGALQTITLLLYLNSRFPGFWRQFDWPLMRHQLSYVLPFGITGILYSLQMDLHNYYVANQFDAATYAVYAVGCFQLPLIGILMESVSSVMIPRVSLLQAQNKPREIVLLTARVMRKLAALSFPLYIFLLVMGREFLTVLFTERYLESWPVFAVNLTFIPLSVLMMDPIRRAYSEHRYFLLRLQLVVLLSLVTVFWLGAGRFGLVEIIAAVVLAAVMERLVTALRLGRAIGVRKEDIVLLKDVGKAAAASLLAGLGVALIRAALPPSHPFVLLILCGVVFALGYVAVLLSTGFVTADERRAAQRLAARALNFAFRRRAFDSAA